MSQKVNRTKNLNWNEEDGNIHFVWFYSRRHRWPIGWLMPIDQHIALQQATSRSAMNNVFIVSSVLIIIWRTTEQNRREKKTSFYSIRRRLAMTTAETMTQQRNMKFIWILRYRGNPILIYFFWLILLYVRRTMEFITFYFAPNFTWLSTHNVLIPENFLFFRDANTPSLFFFFLFSEIERKKEKNQNFTRRHTASTTHWTGRECSVRVLRTPPRQWFLHGSILQEAAFVGVRACVLVSVFGRVVV